VAAGPTGLRSIRLSVIPSGEVMIAERPRDPRR
jgi:hypothetical protein